MNLDVQDQIEQRDSVFGNLQPQMRERIAVYDAVTERRIADIYNQDLNSVVKRLHNQYFVDRKPVIVRDCEGYVEYIGGVRDTSGA